MLLVAASCWSLLLFADICCQLLLVTSLCCLSLVSASNYCRLLLFAAGFCCCLRLFSAVCSYLLLFASQHESKIVQNASQPPQNGPRESPGSPKMPSWGLKKTAQERQNSSPRRPRMPSDTPSGSKSEKSRPFWSLFVDFGSPKLQKNNEISMLFHTCVQRLFSSFFERKNVEKLIEKTM